jgi:glutaconate CoA-transferase subunit A
VSISDGKIPSKLMSEREAVRQFVGDGDTIYCGFTLLPLGLTFEIIRQKKRHLNAVGASNVLGAALLAVAGCVDRMETGYNSGALFAGPTADMMRDGRLKFEDYSNLTMTLRFMAAALGMPFIPSNSFLGTDYLDPALESHSKGLSEDRRKPDGTVTPRLAVVDSPFDGKPTVLLPPCKPDVAIFHCQRADELGNVQAWGPLADSKWALWAADRVIVSAEEIVPTSVITSDAGNTILPGFRVDAVVKNPMGAHPGAVSGYYYKDSHFFALTGMPLTSWETAKRFIDEWVMGPTDRAAYMEHYLEVFGSKLLDEMMVKSPIVPEQPAKSGWR